MRRGSPCILLLLVRGTNNHFVDNFSQGTVRYKKSHEFEIEEFSSFFVWCEVWMSLE